MRIVGLMSGTSADGVDAALVEIEGSGLQADVRLCAHLHGAFGAAMRREILMACEPRSCRVDRVCALHTALGHSYAAAVRGVASEAGVPLSAVDAVACHGQTIWHQPTPLEVAGGAWPGTTQIGSPAELAAAVGIPVVSDFRSADMAAGGQGAPLVPYADVLLFADRCHARAVQNLGGIANVTYVPAGGDLAGVAAFDTGPGNMVIDAVVRHFSRGRRTYDRDGAMARRGTPDAGVIDALLSGEPFFTQSPPKSTGRELFGRRFVLERFLPMCRAARLSAEDTVATATALTARSIAEAYRRWLLPRGGLDLVILGGGGARNTTLRSMLALELSKIVSGCTPLRVTTHEEFGIPDEAKEAMAFAILAYETLHGRPSNVPSATGARRPAVLGSVTPAPGRPWPMVLAHDPGTGSAR